MQMRHVNIKSLFTLIFPCGCDGFEDYHTNVNFGVSLSATFPDRAVKPRNGHQLANTRYLLSATKVGAGKRSAAGPAQRPVRWTVPGKRV